jgi:hypothetical protein
VKRYKKVGNNVLILRGNYQKRDPLFLTEKQGEIGEKMRKFM